MLLCYVTICETDNINPKMMKEEPVAEAKYLVNIMNEKWENDDPRLR